jgi:hypothetical protein
MIHWHSDWQLHHILRKCIQNKIWIQPESQCDLPPKQPEWHNHDEENDEQIQIKLHIGPARLRFSSGMLSDFWPHHLEALNAMISLKVAMGVI